MLSHPSHQEFSMTERESDSSRKRHHYSDTLLANELLGDAQGRRRASDRRRRECTRGSCRRRLARANRKLRHCAVRTTYRNLFAFVFMNG